MSSGPTPVSFKVRTQSRVMEVAFDDGAQFSIPFELLRVYSPSAEVRGHGPGQETLQTGKREVGIVGVEPVGNYGIKPIFSDEHSSGIFTWEYLYQLGRDQDAMWETYLQKLEAAGFTRESGRDQDMSAAGGSACGHHH
ncbi:MULTISPECIES: gamma-butyrobetaine hydroxylase-like domain-containing protein [unclassified Herbaspirillum]|uniref:gamma-butyrobetaine hydroxylase-like domain-containing protein n=1 Tax=unclassified Herbaspirillum TaxID=2624150 RepID=UPI00383BDB47